MYDLDMMRNDEIACFAFIYKMYQAKDKNLRHPPSIEL